MTFRKSCTLLTALLLFLCFILPCASAAEEDSDRLVLPENLKRIESETFANVRATTVVFPDGIEYIAPDAFSGVSGGVGIGSVENTVAKDWCAEHGWTYRPNSRFVALVIANSDYRNNYYCSDLPGVRKDGQAVRNALKNFGWEVTLVENKTAAQMKSSIISCFRGTTERDVCLLFYSGHGDNSYGSNGGSLIGVDYGNSYDQLSPVTLRDTLLGATRGQVIVMLDSCGSGATVFGAESLAGAKKGASRNFVGGVMSAFSGYLKKSSNSKTGELLNARFSVLAACEYGEVSQDGYFSMVDGDLVFRRGGTFTYSILSSMGCSYPAGAYSGSIPADRNNDGRLTLKEAYDGVGAVVKNMNNMLEENDYCARYEGDSYNAPGMYLFDPLDQEVQMGGAGDSVLFWKP